MDEANEKYWIKFNQDEHDPDRFVDDLLGYDDGLEVQEEHQEIRRLIARLSLDQQAVINYRYGFVDGTEYTRIEIARLLDMSIQNVRTLEKNALQYIKRHYSQIDRSEQIKKCQLEFIDLLLNEDARN